jgi:hypothetical protein
MKRQDLGHKKHRAHWIGLELFIGAIDRRDSAVIGIYSIHEMDTSNCFLNPFDPLVRQCFQRVDLVCQEGLAC